MRAVVMAGGEGTRLRPLTSNQPKPMVSLCGKPCMEYILELLAAHGCRETIATLMFMPQTIRDYFGDGASLGMDIDYSVELTPAGTAGSVKLAEDRLRGEPFLVISGDALTDIDLTDLLAFHQRRGALVTIALKRVANPLEFGLVVIDDDGRVLRFLEKPTWGEVFSDAANTGVYVLDPEVLAAIPPGQPFDFSRDLFPALQAAGAPIYGYVTDAYWQDIGSLPQYLAANRDLLDGKLRAKLPGVELRDRVFLEDGVNLDVLTGLTGPAFVGRYARVDAAAKIGPYSVLGSNVVVKAHAELEACVVGANTYIGTAARCRGAILGRECDVKAGSTISEGAAIGDRCVIGEQAYIAPDVNVYPFKTVEAGAQVHTSIVWASRDANRLFGKEGVSGLVNVDITVDLALHLAMAYGTSLPKGALVAVSRDASSAARVVKRAMVAGLNSTGISVEDLRTATSAVNRHSMRTRQAAGGIHVRSTSWDPDKVQIQMIEPPGGNIDALRQREIERLYGRQDFRRVDARELGEIHYADRAEDSYARDLLDTWDIAAIRARHYRLVVDYSCSAAAVTLPRLLGETAAEVLSLRAAAGLHCRPLGGDQRLTRESDNPFADVRRLVTTMKADFGVVVDPAAERLTLIDERGVEVASEQALLLFIRLVATGAHPAASIVLPTTVTRHADDLATAGGLRVVRTAGTPPALAEAALAPGVVFAGTLGGRFMFPPFLPAFDALMSLGVLLERLAPYTQPLSELLTTLPATSVVHRTVACPWTLKGATMRTVTDALRHRAHVEGGDVYLEDGVRFEYRDAWMQLVPDSEEPVVHVFAEGPSLAESEQLAEWLASAAHDGAREGERQQP